MIEESSSLCYRKRSKNTTRDRDRNYRNCRSRQHSTVSSDCCCDFAQDWNKHPSNVLSSSSSSSSIRLPYHHDDDGNNDNDNPLIALSSRLLLSDKNKNKNNIHNTDKSSSFHNKSTNIMDFIIDLSWNSFGPSGVETFFHQVRQQHPPTIIKHLNMKGIDIGRGRGSQAIASFFFDMAAHQEQKQRRRTSQEDQENNINQNNTISASSSSSSSSPSTTNATTTILQSLDLSNTNVNIALVTTSIQHSTSLESLYLDENQLTIQDLHSLRNMLMVNQHLKTLSLRNCQVVMMSDNHNDDDDDDEHEHEHDAYSSSSRMDPENNNDHEDDDVGPPSRIMGRNVLAKALAQGLRCNTSLQELDISWNPVLGGTRGGIDLLTSIFHNSSHNSDNNNHSNNTPRPSLQKIHLQGTHMNDTDLIHLCHLLSNKNSSSCTSSLRSMNLSGNDGITDSSVDALIHMLQAPNCPVEELYLSSNSQISSDNHRRIVMEGLANNYTLHEYRIDGCGGGGGGGGGGVWPEHHHEGQLVVVLQQHIDFYIRLNTHANRKRLLLEPNSIPLSLWPYILERLQDDPSCMYYVLCEIPNLLSMTGTGSNDNVVVHTTRASSSS